MEHEILEKAEKQIQIGNYSAALELFMQLQNLYNIPCETNIAWLYYNLQNYNEAEKYYKISIENGDTYAMHGLAGIYTEQKKYAEAKQYFQMAIEGGRSECVYLLAKVFWRAKEFKESARYLKQAIEIDGNPFAKRDLSFLYMKRKFGFINIFKGLYMYFANFKALVQHAIKVHVK